MSPFCYRNIIRLGLGLGLGLGLVSFMFHTFFLQIVNEKKESNNVRNTVYTYFCNNIYKIYCEIVIILSHKI